MSTFGWQNDQFKSFFPEGLSKPASKTPQPSSAASTNNTGAIAGGVIDGVAAAVILATLAWLYVRKRRRRQQPVELKEETTTIDPYKDTVEVYAGLTSTHASELWTGRERWKTDA